MSIRFSKYVDITSSVAGASPVPVRQLIGRIFTTSLLLPPDSFAEFDNAGDVGTYFGTSSEEYKRALFYFAWISKVFRSPRKLSFASWVNTARAPMIFGATFPKSLAALQLITAGSFTLDIGGVSHLLGPFNFSGAGSFAAVAALIQTAVNAQSGTVWSAATVTYDATFGRFNFVGGVAGVNTISVVEGAINTAAAIGWLPEGTGASFDPASFAIWANGQAIETLTAALTASAGASNNFGSFLFMSALTLSNVQEIGAWEASQNNQFLYSQAVAPADAATWSAGTIAISGLGLTLNSTSGEYPEQEPMMIIAATDYTQRNASQNFMYQQFNLTPSVTTDADSDNYDTLRVNYYGETQSAGQKVRFYQRGKLMGAADGPPTDMNTYANEMWFKSAAGAALINLQLTLPEISAGSQGRAAMLATLQGVINQAKFNATITTGKLLTAAQINAILGITGDPNAWRQVQTSGYWLDVVIALDPDTSEYVATYTIVYSKNDAVRKIIGTHVLI